VNKRVQRFERSWMQNQQSPHAVMIAPMTRSPTFTRVTSPPTSVTVPEASCPGMIGNGRGIPPVATVRSVWHTPLASMRTRTSLGPTGAGSTSSITRGFPNSTRSAAFTRFPFPDPTEFV
jgi:hypothetical protein